MPDSCNSLPLQFAGISEDVSKDVPGASLDQHDCSLLIVWELKHHLLCQVLEGGCSGSMVDSGVVQFRIVSCTKKITNELREVSDRSGSTPLVGLPQCCRIL